MRFENIESAISAYAALDQKYFQGRKLHIKPAQKKPPPVEKDWEKAIRLAKEANPD